MNDIDTLIQKIISASFIVHNQLGSGFLEKIYEKALAIELRKQNIDFQTQYPIDVYYDDLKIGDYFADLLAEEQVLVVLKAVSMLKDEHVAQSLNYLRATGLEICLLINFGTTKVQLKRLRRSVHWKPPTT